MQVTRVHFLNMDGGARVYLDKTNGRMDKAMPISEEMAKCLAVDIQNQLAQRRGYLTPTPWGWVWNLFYDIGPLPVPPTRYYIHTHRPPIEQAPLGHVMLELERR